MQQPSRAWASSARAVFLLAAVATLFSRFFHHGLLLGFYQDDFFYYLKVAENLALYGSSSFDGTHLTNGYHPLWLLTLALLRLGLHGVAFFVALQFLTLASALACYAGAERLLRDLRVPDPFRSLGTLIVSMQALLLLRYGMEITLALPLGIWLAALLLRVDAVRSPRRVVWLGLLGSLTVLGRLDAILLVSLLFALLLWRLPSLRPRLPWLLLGLLPLPCYLAVNRIVFHLLTPVSGHAKQLKATLLPSSSTVLGLVLPLDRMKLIFMLPCLLLLAAGLLLAARHLRHLPAVRRAVLLALLLFPITQVALLSVLSDWNIWPWYFYSFVFSSIASIALLAHLQLRAPATAVLRSAGLALACAYLVYIAAYSIFLPNSISIYLSSRQLSSWMNAHPGTYAMGDQAGMAGYLSSQPMIQLEGLVMDADYLHRLQRRDPLRDILAAYHADYYVTLSAEPPPGPCIALREPGQAGPHSPVSQGSTCSSPLATIPREHVVLYVFNARDIR